MILSDRTIKEEIKKGNIVIKPLDKSAIQPAGIDLRLGYEFRLFVPTKRPFIDPTKDFIDDYTESYTLKKGEFLTIHPGQFVLGIMYEWVEFGNHLTARLDGRSSLGRLGVLIHATAGSVDPGWRGNLVLEISNVGSLPIALYPEMRICKISFHYLTTPSDNVYGSKVLKSKYAGQKGVVTSKLNLEFKKKK
ncbi:MAG: dCTP deaminase [bacterium]|nr:dCTP deaminase [bacterium]